MIKSDLLIVADENMPAVEQIFGEYGQVRRVAGRQLTAEQVIDADLLLVRSVSQVNESLLEQSKVSFVGSATIGTDHIDLDYLAGRGIPFSAAPGCNADAVADYVLSALYQLSQSQGFSLSDKTVGIIGVGNVGGRVRKRLSDLGIKLLLNDPPRGEKEQGFIDIDQLIEHSDIICMHTPLIVGGPYPTHHLMALPQLKALKQGAILLNAGRGPAIDNQALLEVAKLRPDLTLVMDVWEHEPVVDRELADLCEIATPHIAGYSLDGKIRGTFMLYEAWCKTQGITPRYQLTELLPPSGFQRVALNSQADILDLIRVCYDPYRDDRALRKTLHLPADERALAFDRLRKNYPQRREFLTLPVETTDKSLAATLEAASFSVVSGT